jgi:hypothetical protein
LFSFAKFDDSSTDWANRVGQPRSSNITLAHQAISRTGAYFANPWEEDAIISAGIDLTFDSNGGFQLPHAVTHPDVYELPLVSSGYKYMSAFIYAGMYW